MPHSIGYINLPGFSGNTIQTQQYAQITQDLIRTQDQVARCGWIVDLRLNSGGNMWPMLAGIGPILGDGDAGAFQFPSMTARWGYHQSQGSAYLEDSAQLQVANPYELRQPMPLVAVLTGHGTGSSGEVIAIAFRGRSLSRSFGLSTYGFATANSSRVLSDGAIIALTTANDVDRLGVVYGEKPILPDEVVGGQNDPQQAAINWLVQQPTCTGK